MESNDATGIVRARTARGLARTVRIEDGVVIKEYRRVRMISDVRRPWAREHRALVRLKQQGVPAPESFGYVSPERGVVRARRSFVGGRSVGGLEGEELRRFARHFAEIHDARVTMGDASLDNLMVTPDGHCMCIDYGRSRVFWFQSPLFFFYVGKELIRIQRRLFGGRTAAWAEFLAAYREAARHPDWAWTVIGWSEAFWRLRWQRRWGDFRDEIAADAR